MRQRLLQWWHRQRGYHAAPGILSIFQDRLTQRCSCGAERVTHFDLPPSQQPIIEYNYWWSA